jgi:nucleoid-associated protein YgaU
MAAPDPTSRYAGLPEIAIVAADGSIRVLGAPRVVPSAPVGGSYTIRPGDRLDLLALVAAGDSTRWWLLADANPFSDATRLEEPGRSIDLPDA